ncbi:MAG: asparagine synthase (glutamine-hydrolyzing) [Deltaproteobacteria bacterium]|nr:asparagine synthase (glutamine-hydrolyzing) [Deltaproteobacteria bacterium]
MCGIFGFVHHDPHRPAERRRVEAGLDALVHRGPDGTGVHIDGPVGLGHRRLSIIDIVGSEQPLTNEDGSVVVTYNGEIYNYQELRRELVTRGHRLRTAGDTEVLVHLYEDFGPDLVRKLRGMFAFAIWDRRKRRLVLARDRVGIKPLYYAETQKSFVFGSELDSLVQSGLIDRTWNQEAIDEYFSLGYILAPRTIFESIHHLPPAHVLVYEPDSGRIETNRYWQPPFEAKRLGNYEEAKEEFDALLQDAVRVRLMSEVPLGALLSGGLDSSTVVWQMVRAASGPVSTFSIGFDDEDYNELAYARAVAERFETNHHEMMVTPSAVEVLPTIVARHGEPFGDSSSIPTYYVAQMARKHVTVCLSGDGGDELLFGYNRYLKFRQDQRRYGHLPAAARHALARTRGLFHPDGPMHNFLRRLDEDIEGQYAYLTSNFTVEMRRRLFAGPDPIGGSRPGGNGSAGGGPTIRPDALEAFAQARGAGRSLDPVASAAAADFMRYLPGDILTKVDRMSMAHSLEARVPLLDHKVVEFAWSLPTEWKLKGNKTKRILRDLIEPHMPAEVLSHRKQGFSVPLARWFRTELKDMLADALHCDLYQKSGRFQGDYVLDLFWQHQSGRFDHRHRLWLLLVFALWDRHSDEVASKAFAEP